MALKKKGVSARKASIDVVGHDGLIRDIRAGRMPSFDRVKELFEYLDLELYAGEPREAKFMGNSLSSDRLAPLKGTAACGLGAKSNLTDGEDPLPMPSWIDDDSAFWIRASGKSMQREGINSGDYCLVSPGRQARPGDRVYLMTRDGKAIIKRLLSLDTDRIELRGWQDPRDDTQTDYSDTQFRKFVEVIFPVVAVYRGRPGNPKRGAEYIPDPRVPELPRHDGMVQVEVLLESLAAGRHPGIPTTLSFHERWLRATGCAPTDAALVAVIDGEMEPTFTTRSIALVDRSKTTVENNAIYAIRREKRVLLRRLEALLNGTLIIRGDNPAAQSSVLPLDRAGDIDIVGKVIWSGHHH